MTGWASTKKGFMRSHTSEIQKSSEEGLGTRISLAVLPAGIMMSCTVKVGVSGCSFWWVVMKVFLKWSSEDY